MITVNIRKQGGAAVITIPSDILRMLDLHIGSELALDISKDSFTAHPLKKKEQNRYSLEELLQGVTPQVIAAIKEETKWAREGDSVGRETP